VADPLPELSIFLDYMDPMLSVIARETNIYVQKKPSDSGRRKRKDNDRWFDTIEDEMKVCFPSAF
jgi:hypothetical protein